jgi:hypothetical protein
MDSFGCERVLVLGPCEHGNEFLSSVKGRIYLYQLSGCQLPEKDSLPWSYRVLTTVRLYVGTCPT